METTAYPRPSSRQVLAVVAAAPAGIGLASRTRIDRHGNATAGGPDIGAPETYAQPSGTEGGDLVGDAQCVGLSSGVRLGAIATRRPGAWWAPLLGKPPLAGHTVADGCRTASSHSDRGRARNDVRGSWPASEGSQCLRFAPARVLHAPPDLRTRPHPRTGTKSWLHDPQSRAGWPADVEGVELPLADVPPDSSGVPDQQTHPSAHHIGGQRCYLYAVPR